jgi:hypothetical protein
MVEEKAKLMKGRYQERMRIPGMELVTSLAWVKARSFSLISKPALAHTCSFMPMAVGELMQSVSI